MASINCSSTKLDPLFLELVRGSQPRIIDLGPEAEQQTFKGTMPPRPARAPSGKAAAATPQALTAAFLLEADAALAPAVPHLAAHLGRQALQVS